MVNPSRHAAARGIVPETVTASPRAQRPLLPPASRADLIRAAWARHRHLHRRYTLDQALADPGLAAALRGHARSLERRADRG